jgi:hypothetical protein
VRRLVEALVQRPLEHHPDDRHHDECDRQRGEERHAELVHQQRADVAAEHRERSVREIDEVHQAHRDRQADADQEQQASVRDAVEEHADEIDDRRHCCSEERRGE